MIEDYITNFKKEATVLLNQSLKENPKGWSFGVAYDPFLQALCDLQYKTLETVIQQESNRARIDELKTIDNHIEKYLELPNLFPAQEGSHGIKMNKLGWTQVGRFVKDRLAQLESGQDD